MCLWTKVFETTLKQNKKSRVSIHDLAPLVYLANKHDKKIHLLIKIIRVKGWKQLLPFGQKSNMAKFYWFACSRHIK